MSSSELVLLLMLLHELVLINVGSGRVFRGEMVICGVVFTRSHAIQRYDGFCSRLVIHDRQYFEILDRRPELRVGCEIDE